MNTHRLSQLILPATLIIWTLYGFLSGFGHWNAAVSVALVASVGLIALMGARHVTIKVMDWTMVIYFAIAGVATFAFRSSTFRGCSPIVIWVLYAAAAWASILLGKPFSLQYARESTPTNLWQNSLFIRTNMIISGGWGLSFLLNVILVIVASRVPLISLWIGVLAPILVMGAASIFTTVYSRSIRARHPLTNAV